MSRNVAKVSSDFRPTRWSLRYESQCGESFVRHCWGLSYGLPFGDNVFFVVK